MIAEKVKLCECGCGEPVKAKRNGTLNRFINYHCKRSDEAKRKISETQKGRKLTKEHKKKLSKAHKNRKTSKETREKLSKANKGKKHTKETKEKLSKIHTGKKLSEECKRKMSESRMGRICSEKTRKKIGDAQRGEKAHNWKGGISFDPYIIEFNDKLKTKIRNRDNNTCQNPHCNKKNNKKIRKGDVHHINYIKADCREENLITLCSSCHSKTNHNRIYWQEFCEKIINLKYSQD